MRVFAEFQLRCVGREADDVSLQLEVGEALRRIAAGVDTIVSV